MRATRFLGIHGCAGPLDCAPQLRDLRGCMICMTVQSACLHRPHDYAISATANPHGCGSSQGRQPSLRYRAQMHQHLSHSRRGLDRVSTSDSQSSPHGRPSQHAPANRSQLETAEYQGSLITADQSHSRAHIDSSVLLGPNPISVFDSRISPRKQAVRQTDTIDIHPKTAESRGSQTTISQPTNQSRLPSRTKSNLEV